MNHIVDTCPLTKFEGGLNLLHKADDDAVIWLESTATAALAKYACAVWHSSLRTGQSKKYVGVTAETSNKNHLQ